MRVLGFHTRKHRNDTVIVKLDNEIVALDRRQLENAVGAGEPIMVEQGDLLPSRNARSMRVEVHANVLTNFERNLRK